MIYLGSDHAGFELKKSISKYFEKNKIDYSDLGTFNKDPVDYPDIAKKVCDKVVKKRSNKGILICGTGTGMSIAANKIKGIRATLAYDNYSAKMSKHDNDVNVLCLRSRFIDTSKTNKIVQTWLNESFSKQKRHNIRIKKIKELEK